LIVIEQIHPQSALPTAAHGYARDTITLESDARARLRGWRRSDGGITFGLSLPRGTILRGGDCLVLDELETVVVVIERPEPVCLIEPRTPQEWGLYAYHIGNRHQPLMITETGIVCPVVDGVERFLERQGIPFVRTILPFTPTTSAAGDRD
jgi:urease accessory protein